MIKQGIQERELIEPEGQTPPRGFKPAAEYKSKE